MRTGRDEGQATVELALVLPVVAACLLLVVQVALVVRDQVLVVHASREAAREAAVDPSPGAPRRAAATAAALAADRLDVEAQRGAVGERVRVRVRYRSRTDVPLVGAFVPDVPLSATTTMRVET